jgi:filamentous hemagglutinin family protein
MIKTRFLLSFLTLANLLISTQIIRAQTYQPSNRSPVADNTLGTQVSGNSNNFNITGGLSKGQTLFHSFTDFSVPTNGSANFLNPVGNRDIITRVTGTVFSDINGLVNTNGANFFLINPNGIVFGKNAQLNVGKVFVGSTASSLDLVDGGGRLITFGANLNGDAPLLSIAPNVLFNVSRLNVGGGNGQITNFGTLQTPNNGQYIGLIGGNISLNGGQINTTGGRVDLGGLSVAGSVTFGVQGEAQLPINVARGDVSLTNGARVDVSGGGIEITARNLTVTNEAQLVASTKGQGNAGSVKITATGDVFFDGRKNGFSSAVASTVEQGAVGNGGGIEITARNLTVTNGAQLVASTFGQGNAGSVKITATGDVSFDGIKDGFGSTVFSSVEQGAIGNGGGIEITARNLTVTNGAQLEASTKGQGNAGSVKITATGDISFDGRKDGLSSKALSSVGQGAMGKGGMIEITARNLTVTNGAQLVASTFGQGNAGSVKITATGDVSFDGIKDGLGSTAFSSVEQGAVGNGGGIEITARNLTVTNEAKLEASTKGQGDAGNIGLNANLIVLNKGQILSISSSSTGGNLNITTTGYLLLQNKSSITTDSRSIATNGNGGNITIDSPLIIAAPGNNDISANAEKGKGGRVNITSQGLFGIQYRPTGSDFTNDITASSTFGQSGTVNVNTPGTDPGKDSTELPKVTTDATNQISQVCSADNRQNKLTVTGRGGLPPNASDPLTSDVIWQDARAASSQPTASTTTNPVTLAPPAVGWVFDGKGKVTLVAAGTQGQPTGTSVVCPNVK